MDMSSPTANGGPFAGLALKNIKDSLIIAGHVAGAAHITGVHDSVIVVQSRQVRMHDCKNVDIYLHCSSRPIIEDCSNIRFAPIPECHVSLDWFSAKEFRNTNITSRRVPQLNLLKTNGTRSMISSG